MKLTLRILSLLAVAGASSAFGQTTYSYDFGTGTGTYSTNNSASTSFLPSPETGGGTARVRVSNNQAGSFALANPGNASLGSGSELVVTAPTGGSVNKFSIYDFTGASTQVSIKFDVILGGGSSGVFYFLAGDGATYSDNNAINSAQTFSGLRWTFGASDAISTSVRSGSSWVTTGITGTPFSQNNVYSVQIVGNNSASVVDYVLSGSQSIAANSYDVWINGVLIGNDLTKGGLASGTAIDSFMFYGESSTGNVANIRLDNLVYGSALPSAVPEPSSFAALAGVGALGFCALRRRRSA